ncbi:CLUMA_CG003667, isoform A [Clunio marinus]|uniref:CLUMA_CG003667, isoform A n=1 Tax=Clunio marinus TaxID=568069 RepID=A0A1J1HQX2_9DIPT|nr:CLUMA_CG003667, isoform A [Clunio marinus]
MSCGCDVQFLILMILNFDRESPKHLPRTTSKNIAYVCNEFRASLTSKSRSYPNLAGSSKAFYFNFNITGRPEKPCATVSFII